MKKIVSHFIQREQRKNNLLVPFIGRVGASFPEHFEDAQVLGYLTVRKTPSLKEKELFAVEVRGRSMEHTLEDGE